MKQDLLIFVYLYIRGREVNSICLQITSVGIWVQSITNTGAERLHKLCYYACNHAASDPGHLKVTRKEVVRIDSSKIFNLCRRLRWWKYRYAARWATQERQAATTLTAPFWLVVFKSILINFDEKNPWIISCLWILLIEWTTTASIARIISPLKPFTEDHAHSVISVSWGVIISHQNVPRFECLINISAVESERRPFPTWKRRYGEKMTQMNRGRKD
jgi:hypothetical protein